MDELMKDWAKGAQTALVVVFVSLVVAGIAYLCGVAFGVAGAIAVLVFTYAIVLFTPFIYLGVQKLRKMMRKKLDTKEIV